MNPICLLTPGRTYKEMADRPGAYKLLAQTAPLKRSGKRPGSRPSHPVEEPEQKSLFERVPEPIEGPVVPEPVAVEAAPEIPAQVEVVQEIEPVIPAIPVIPPEPVIPVAEVAQEAETAEVKNPFVAPQHKPVRTPAMACKEWLQKMISSGKRRSSGGATVQAEFALEKVTVLRNDLNEDDLEVVLVERKVGTGEKPLARLSKMEMPTEAWTRLTAAFRRKNSESASNPKAEAQPSPELSARA